MFYSKILNSSLMCLQSVHLYVGKGTMVSCDEPVINFDTFLIIVTSSKKRPSHFSHFIVGWSLKSIFICVSCIIKIYKIYYHKSNYFGNLTLGWFSKYLRIFFINIFNALCFPFLVLAIFIILNHKFNFSC